MVGNRITFEHVGNSFEVLNSARAGCVPIYLLLISHSCNVRILAIYTYRHYLYRESLSRPLVAAVWSLTGLYPVAVFQPRVIELLYQHGADLTAKTRNGETAFGELSEPLLVHRDTLGGDITWAVDRLRHIGVLF